ncbi:MAG: OmpH family outer membrane protein [Candidatus Ratteibacteria bacterium]|nr:OmpH family outer membrane protein [Candidatus Ratteibacteria bacterium]
MKCLWKEKGIKNEKMVEVLLAGVILVLAVILLIIWIVKPGNGKIASVDMNKIMNSHPAMQEAMASFEKEVSNLQQQVNKMNDEEKAKQQQKIQQEITQIAMKLQQEVMDKVVKDIEMVAKKKGYSYVIDRSAIIVGGKDITDEILGAVTQKKEEKEKEKLDVSEMPMIPVK